MDIEEYIQDAILMVDCWDLPEEDVSTAINQQARLMAGMGLEPSTDIPVDSPYSALQF